MKDWWRKKNFLDRCEFAAAAVLSLLLLVLHLVFSFRAGPLWRDEISSLRLATMPTLSEVWKFLPFDPFPISYFLLLRSWQALGFAATDFGLRILGLLIGISLIGALWFSSHVINKSAPLWPLALFALNPFVLEIGDSLRPYGFGLIWIVLSAGLIWRVTFQKFRKPTILLAVVAALLSVQSLFTNALLLFAVCLGAFAILLKRKSWDRMTLIICIGFVSALSILPYLSIFRATRDWLEIAAGDTSLVSVTSSFFDAIRDGGAVAEATWLLWGGILILIPAILWSRPLARFFEAKRDHVMFAAIALFLSIVCTATFLCHAQYRIFPRYFLPLMAIGALAIHIFSEALRTRPQLRVINLCAVLLIAATAVPDFYERAKTRLTNCDRIAATLQARAETGDVVIVTSFFYAVSFQRYYHGAASWHAVPDVADSTLHRWDLLKEAMTHTDPMQKIVSDIESALKSGHRVFLVGKLHSSPTLQPDPLPPAPQSEYGWQMTPYFNNWKSELSFYIEHHAVHGSDLPVEAGPIVNLAETLGLFEVSGWRER